MELVIDRYGASLSVKNGMFHVHHDEGTQDIPVDKVRSISLGRSVSVTVDALMLAIEQEIDVIFPDRKGIPLGRIWSPRYGSISTIRKNQLAFSTHPDALGWVKTILGRKLENMTALLLTVSVGSTCDEVDIQGYIGEIEKYRLKIGQLELPGLPEAAATLRGFEGSASRIYFDCIGKFLPESYRFERRSQHPALDMFNCLLNYSYGILYGKTEGALIRAGLDPYVGIFHRDEYNRPVLVYDVIEIFRAWADFVVINLCMQQVVFIEFFEVENQVFYLNNSGKRILIQSFNDYLDEITLMNGIERSRSTHIDLYAQQLAALFKEFRS